MQNKIRENFVRWYKLTHWNYDPDGLVNLGWKTYLLHIAQDLTEQTKKRRN